MVIVADENAVVGLDKPPTALIFQAAPEADSVYVPLPPVKVRVPAPVPLKPPLALRVMLLLALLSMTHPVVAAVQAPQVNCCIVGLVAAAIVIVQVTPPTQVAPSNITASPEPGTDAPVAPPVDVDHIAVLELSHVHVTVHTPNRLAASAGFASASPIRAIATALFSHMGHLSFICYVDIHRRRRGVCRIGQPKPRRDAQAKAS